ncbi:MAG: hypothetical protein HWE27_13215 [Gammaproteobacteria bacterium]|nr:hypothetical protein [Gammaproteobacteria bacterium]
MKSSVISLLIIFAVILSPAHLSAAESNSNQEQATTVVQDAQLGLTITGNKELPNVLYIVPWKKGPKNIVSPIQGRIVDEVYGPVELNVFQRRVKLYRDLQAKNKAQEE